jgi:hypothetical protein
MLFRLLNSQRSWLGRYMREVGVAREHLAAHAHPLLAGENHVTGLARFLQIWGSGEEAKAPEIEAISTSASGNINVDGSSSCFRSVLLTRWHPSFPVVLEGGVRDLVLVCVQKFNWVTYSSCEGHPPSSRLDLRTRHVGILPRSALEEENILSALVTAARKSHRQASKACRVRIAINIARITSEDGDARAVDLVFLPIRGSECQYLGEVRGLYSLFLNALEQVTV